MKFLLGRMVVVGRGCCCCCSCLMFLIGDPVVIVVVGRSDHNRNKTAKNKMQAKEKK